jgi:eukaryotic-like serine/threonine-protein kinase
MTQTTAHRDIFAPPVHRGGADGSSESSGAVGQWRIIELAAESDLSRVYRARPIDASDDSNACYALKTLQPRWEDDERAIAMFAREALVGRRVSHPCVISILDARLAKSPRYVVMPWLEGATFKSHLDSARPLELPEVLWFVRQAAQGLDALHRAGWMHGDIKPDNMFISSQGRVTLLDLGFARAVDESGSAAARVVTGTCGYMAPEWITSALRADIRSDIYSLGVVLFEAIAGRLPYEAADLAALATAHRQQSPPSLRSLVPHLPSEVAALVHRMITKEPLRRPQTPRELAGMLTDLEIATFAYRTWR